MSSDNPVLPSEQRSNEGGPGPGQYYHAEEWNKGLSIPSTGREPTLLSIPHPQRPDHVGAYSDPGMLHATKNVFLQDSMQMWCKKNGERRVRQMWATMQQLCHRAAEKRKGVGKGVETKGVETKLSFKEAHHPKQSSGK
jgi:hypothetical protein